jgi:hypothetical protein
VLELKVKFDKQIPKLVDNFSKDKKVLNSLKQKKNYFISILKENLNPTLNKSWEW